MKTEFTFKSIPSMIGAALVGVPLVMLILSIQAALRGWALTYLWAWFVVPFFHLPPLNVPYALGLCLVGGIMSNGFGRGSRIKDEYTETIVWGSFIAPFFVLLAGWIITKFM